jgi:thiol:disulfide interchange protein DsbD
MPSILSRARAALIALLSLLFLLAAPARAAEEFLDPTLAFRLSARMEGERTAVVTWAIADGYYMYRERFKFTATGAKLGAPQIPPGKVKYDETFQKDVETYHDSVTIRIPVEGSGPFTLNVTSQGCADAGLCYPPQEASIQLAAGGAAPQASLPIGANAPGASIPMLSVQAAQRRRRGRRAACASSGRGAGNGQRCRRPGTGHRQRCAGAVRAGRHRRHPAGRPPARHRARVRAAGAGPGLHALRAADGADPVLRSSWARAARRRRSRGLVLSATYSLGMAIVYTLGVAAGLLGEGLAAALQNPWVLGAFALLIVDAGAVDVRLL